MRGLAPLATVLSLCCGTAFADTTLFQNVRVFDGTAAELSGPVNVLVEDNLIARISADPIATEPGATLVDGAGGTLMPGLIDAHTHLVMSTISIAELMTADPNYVMLRAGKAAEEQLLRGFTTARDMGGPTFGLKRAIDEGYVAGPRIYPSGAMISQTSGHGDFRRITDLPRRDGDLDMSERYGYAAIADGPDEVLRRTREQLFQGASQIKVMAGGGVSSDHDPLDSSQYTEAEIHAAVEAAADWNTYVTVHAYTPDAIRKAIEDVHGLCMRCAFKKTTLTYAPPEILASQSTPGHPAQALSRRSPSAMSSVAPA
jgi:imidazolonepropionase-like amidohydrolase